MSPIQPRLMFLLLCLNTISLQAQNKSELADSTMMQEVSINGQRQRISYRLDRQKIDASQVLTAQGGTALDVLRAVAGVVVDADGNLSYRGSQNFMVYVDGKPSPLSGTEALQMVGAASIKDIEILTTPSAKYKTDGDVGIINIVTRRSETDGWDIALNGTASTWGTLSLDTKVNFRTGHHNFYAGGQGSDIHNKSQFEQEKTTSANGTTVTSFADGTRFRDFRTFIGQGGYEFSNGRHYLNIDLQGGRTINPRGGDMVYNTTTTTDGLPPVSNVLDSRDRYKLTKKLFQTSIDYSWKLNERGDEISLSSRFRYDRFSEEYTESNMYDQNGNRQE
ncbi:MAG: TonB-dependent receptor plug domain-containing protein, partial [Bacteroidaceae bacterium]|nr:TonB-dependent receptor plug domain-containing protein [Bacteroidaceae bacterium]